MPKTVFFSWQADTPTREGRNFVERSLERAISRVGEDTELEEAIRELAVDKDTQGVAGSPPIVETIFRKIDQTAVFVPMDVQLRIQMYSSSTAGRSSHWAILA